MKRQGDKSKNPADIRTGFKNGYYRWYTVVFLLTVAGMFLPFLLTGRSMVWLNDGRSQYYPQMVYVRRYLQDLLAGLFHGEPDIQFYDFSIGMGDGILTAARLHRMDMLGIFVPEKMLGILYTFIILLRLYLSGIFFSMYCRFRKMNDRAILAGCVVYISCGFAMRRVTMHPFFGAAMMMLPMMLLGVEKILQEGKGIWMILSVAAAFQSTYYYAYMCTIAVGVYFLLRWPAVRSEVRTGRGGRMAAFFRKGFHVLGAWLIGLGTMTWLLVPIFSHLFSSDRVKVEDAGSVLFRYPLKYFGNLVLSFISPNVEAGYNTRLNFIALVIPVLVILFMEKYPKVMSLRLGLLLQAAGVMIPAVGLVMGGFGNVNNRWTFILAFTLAYACVFVVQEGPVYGKLSRIVLFVITMLYSAGTLALILFGDRFHISSGYRLNIASGCVCLILTSAAVFLMSRNNVSYRLHCSVITALAVSSAAVMGIVTFMPGLGGAVTEFMKWSDLPSYYENLPQKQLSNLAESEFCRVDTGYSRKGWQNLSLYYDYYGIAEFNSVLNSYEQQFLIDLENPGIDGNIRFMSMDGRAALENLASVGYYLTDSEDGIIPYGFAKADDQADDENVLYENQIPLNFAYTYDTVLSAEEYAELDAAQKQQALLKAAVLEPEDIAALPAQLLRQEIPDTEVITVPVSDGAPLWEADGNRIKTEFAYQRKAGYECYLRLKDISFKSSGEPEDEKYLVISNSSGKKVLYLTDPDSPYYVPLDSVMVYMGYSEQNGQDEMSVRFDGKGSISIGSVELCYIPMDSYAEEIGERNEGGCASAEVTTNKVEGNLSDSDARFVVLSVLYSNGWSAKVDGEPVKLVRANGCYTGFYVPEGEHHFELTYMPRHFIMACAVSGISLIICIFVFARTLMRNKSGREAR